MIDIQRIQRVPLRQIWQNEATDFTPWLQDNLDVLNDVLDLDLTGAEREQSAGDFNVDLVAEDASGNTVIIENQLERSNHDHLGKLVTYLSAMGAKSAIWIVSDPRPEHVGAIAWLNESSAADFYLVKLEAIRIGESSPAPLLTVISQPSIEGKSVGATKKDIAERHVLRREFWTGLLEDAKNKTRLHENISPGDYSWISASAGIRGLGYNYSVTQHGSAVELYIDRGKESGEENTRIFETLEAQKITVESEFGEELEWERLEGRRACRIARRYESGGYRDKDRWDQVYTQVVDAMIRLDKALRGHIHNLRVK
ncbi:MAG: DUF4268 domain-containing protein [Candidatus Poribacteria bacterium]|nr:DUF4268 domain-containing protein [Candidatus Poribacteria bacterium]